MLVLVLPVARKPVFALRPELVRPLVHLWFTLVILALAFACVYPKALARELAVTRYPAFSKPPRPASLFSAAPNDPPKPSARARANPRRLTPVRRRRVTESFSMQVGHSVTYPVTYPEAYPVSLTRRL